MTTTLGLDSLTLPTHTVIWTEQPGACTRCRRMAVLFINRAGRVLCTDCDAQPQKEAS